MYITEIEIADLRCFRGTHKVSLQHTDGGYAGWTVFSGRNGAGKSTLLKALALSVIGPLASRSLAGVFDDWVHREAQAAYVGTALLRDKQRDPSKTGRPSNDPFWTGLKWKTNSHGPDTLERWADPRMTGTRLADNGPWADGRAGWFVAGYGPYRHLGPAPAEVVRLSADPVLARLVNLFNESATLSEAVDWLQQLHLRALEERPGAAELRDAVLSVLSDGLLPDGSVVKRVDSEGLWIERDGISVPLEQVSDGYRTVAALVVDLLRRLHEAFGQLDLVVEAQGHVVCPLPGVVLIDEVDAHMHVAWQQQIGFWLTQRFPQLQFLVTTHSPFICQAGSPGGLIRLPAPGEPRRIEPVGDEVWRAVVQGGADDAVLTELFGLDHAHSKAAEGKRRTLAELEAKILRGGATSQETREYETLKQGITESLGELADRRLRSLLRARS